MILQNIWRGVVSNDLTNILSLTIFQSILLAAIFLHNYVAAFGRCEH